MGGFRKEESHQMTESLRCALKWIDNGHTNFHDENTIILCLKRTDGLLLSHGTRFEIEFE